MNMQFNVKNGRYLVFLLPLLMMVAGTVQGTALSGSRSIDVLTGGDCREEAATMCTECRRLFDSDVPFPFQDLNTRVELRDGELYKLVGFLDKINEGYVLSIDPVVHPWLTNRATPYSRVYPVVSSSVSLKKYVGENVQLIAQAVGHIEVPSKGNGQPYYLIYLRVFAEVGGVEQVGPGR